MPKRPPTRRAPARPDPAALAPLQAALRLARGGDREGALALLDQAPPTTRLLDDYTALRANLLAQSVTDKPRMREAEALFSSLDKAGKLSPALQVNFANLLKALGKLDLARRKLGKIVKTRSDIPGAVSNLAAIEYERADWPAAETLFRQALEQDPNDHRARRGLGHLRLGLSDFEEGWAGYAARFRLPPPTVPPKALAERPLWSGEPLEGRRLALWREQGVGEELLFGSLLPEMAARAVAEGGGLIALLDARLAPAFARACPDAEILSDPADPRLAAADLHAPLGALGPALRPSAAAFPPPRPALTPDPDRAAEMRAWLDGVAQGRPAVGLSWRSRLVRSADKKSIPLETWTPVLARRDLCFVDLQYGDTAEDLALARQASGAEIARHPSLDKKDDLEGLAALIAALDQTLTISNATAHLAGSIGAPVQLLLAPSHFWYWRYRGETDGLWYPNQRIWRRVEADWAPVLRAAAKALPNSA